MKFFNRIIQNLMMLCTIAAIWVTFYQNHVVEKEIPEIIEPERITIAEEIPQMEDGLININTANAHQLQTLSGIGEAKARAIIEYRDEHGYFESVDDLVNVSGIGDKMLEQIRHLITV